METYRSAPLPVVPRRRVAPRAVVWFVALTVPTLLWGLFFAFLETKRRPIAAVCERPSSCPLVMPRASAK
jgi:hypothetical protein